MILVVEILFIALLIFLLTIVNRNERLSAKTCLSHAVIEQYWDGKNRRKYSRFKKELKVIYSIEKKQHLKNNACTVDISEGGMKLLLDKKLSNGSVLGLKVEMPDVRDTAEVECRVVWSEELKGDNADGKRLFYTGLEFCAIREPHGMPLVNYIRSLVDES